MQPQGPERRADGATGAPWADSGLDARDLLAEASAAVLARPGRALLTVLGTVLGIAALVATVGIAQTAASQVSSRFDLLEQTSVTVRPLQQGTDAVGVPWDAGDRLQRLNGVAAAGTLTPVDAGATSISAAAFAGAPRVNDVSLLAASPNLLQSVDATVEGRVFDQGHSDRKDPVALLGAAVARQLHMTHVSQRPAVAIGSDWLSVIGIIHDAPRESSLLNAVVVPDGYAIARYGVAAPGEVRIKTDIGAAQLIARQAPVALSPNDPANLEVLAPPSPQSLRSRVEGDVNSLFLILGGISLLIGALGIANVTLVGVLERVGEIGLRRSLGAKRSHIAAQVLTESATLGLAGGVVGASAGVLVTVFVAWSKTWVPVLTPWIAVAAPALGALVGVAAGAYPAFRAASLEPVDALRYGT